MSNTLYRSILVCVVLVGCSTLITGQERSGYWPGRDWRTGTPEEQGMDSALIYEALKTIKDEELRVDSLLIARNGYLVIEGYFHGKQRDRLCPLYSGTKSVISALIGIAVDNGLLRNVGQRPLDILTGIDEGVKKTDKGLITLENFLTMSSGLQVMGGFPLLNSPDALKTVIELPIAKKPGQFQYNGAAPQILSAVIQQVTGKSAFAYAQEKLFGPLGITAAEWGSDKKGMSIGGTGLSLRAFDMVKFGYLYLRNGIWNKRQIVSPSWIETSTKKHVESKPMNSAEDYGYGYLWWINSFGGFSVHGAGGQYIFVVPDKDMVVVFTGELDLKDFPKPYELTEKCLLKAVKSDVALPANKTMNESIESLMKTLGTP